MSWTITERSQTGEVQYIIATHPNIGPGTSSILNVSGYTQGTISTDTGAGTATVTINGSNDGTNFFPISPAKVFIPATNYVSWSVPVKFIQVDFSAAATDIFLMASAGGSGQLDAGSGGSAAAAPPDKSIQFNDGGFFGGADGALYDKTANANTGQVQFANGTEAVPSIGFINNIGTGIRRDPVDADIEDLCFSMGGIEGLRVSMDVPFTESVTENGGGDDLIAGVNFGQSTLDDGLGTGIYHKVGTGANQALAISCDNDVQSGEMVSVYKADALPFIKGLNVGTNTAGAAGLAPLGIRRLSMTGSLTGVNSWEDGHMGNSNQLVFTPSDFMIANPSAGRVGAITSAFINLCNNGTGWDQASGGRFGIPSLCTANAADTIVATKLIPKGFQISADDSITIHGLTNPFVTDRVAVACRDITNPGPAVGNPAQLVGYTFNNSTALTGLTAQGGGIPVGNGTNMIIIYIDPGQQLLTNQGAITGAIISMKRV